MTALIVITLGGLGHIVGSLVGALLLGMVESFGMYLTKLFLDLRERLDNRRAPAYLTVKLINHSVQ